MILDVCVQFVQIVRFVHEGIGAVLSFKWWIRLCSPQVLGFGWFDHAHHGLGILDYGMGKMGPLFLAVEAALGDLRCASRVVF